MSYGSSYYQDNVPSAYGTGGNYPTRSFPTGTPAGTTSRPTFQTEKMEENLALHIKKALSPEETAPKQKHVRACIVYTWDIKSSGSFWMAVQTYPVLGDELVTFKALLTVHKVMREGHPKVLKDAISQSSWFENLARGVHPNTHRGYGVLIRAYVQFLLAKLEYHRLHPEFRGNFDYEEYVTLKGVEDPNEGFETINDLLILLDKLDSLQKLIFVNFRPTSNNEARIAALVPLVEESYGIYQFLVTMLTAMHQIMGSVEVLAPLRDKFKAGHFALFKFYHECSTLKYLTSLITVPRLPQDPPDFLAQGPPTRPPRSESPDKQQSEIDRFNREQDRLAKELMEEQEREQQRIMAERELEDARQRQMLLQQQQQQQQEDMQRRAHEEFLRQQEAERRRMEEERQRMQQQASAANLYMENQLQQQRMLNAANELDQYKNQSFRDKELLHQYDMKVKALEQQLSQLSVGNRDMDHAKDDLLRRLQDELAQWKQKYEALAKLYAQLRKEHLDLLTKFKDVRDTANRQTEQARKDVEKAKADQKTKSNEMTELLIERDRLKGEVDRVRGQYEEEMHRLRRDLDDAKASLKDMSTSKGAEMQNIVARFEAEKAELEELNKSKNQQLDDLRRQLENASADLQRYRANQEEESAVLSTGLDQTLLALAAQQKAAQDAQRERDQALSQLGSVKSDHLRQLNSMMDNLLQSCISTVDEAIYEMDSPANMGNQTASPEYVLSLLEKSQALCNDFGTSFVKLVQTGDHKEAIASSTSFAHSVSQLLHNAKGVTRLAAEDDQIEEIVRTVKLGALGGRLFFDQVKSVSLDTIDASHRPEHILSLSKETQHQLGRMSGLIERLVVNKIDEAKANLEDEVEKSMKSAAQAIEDAAKRLEALFNKKREGKDLDVHSAILQAAMAITSAIAMLIQRATETQQEIVAHGRGSTTSGQFYKKNNKWTEGLISAAHAVASATTTLVECADGLVSGTHSYEQLVVAAQEVSVATTQLVAASRVKSIPFSKTQTKLEDAAVAVRKATELLVKAAKEAAKRGAESSAQHDIDRLSKHQLKVAEMEQKVKILEIEKDLSTARYRLGELVKKGYRPEEDE
ncbi:ANTH domain-containing protein [Fimicolochytrium jonesii]|uniref:ANTH domain-containing protein n=1 Tax=Fimicolochytrium jonesii TaxID=1396493 RepID=UPI0022FE1F49|nr:ANTH domain-containing protein [Fimicolochytrium jonesii]KAI8819450.1 ANTH domain-containing protein [Fimicolochytrium jonesii]